MGTRELFTAFEQLRGDEPVLWAITRGSPHVSSVAKLLLWPVQMVERDLAEIREVIWVENNTKLDLNPESDRYDQLMELRVFSRRIFDSIVANTPKVERKSVTAKQKRLFNLLEKLGTEPFTTLQAAQAQGYDKAGFTKAQLETLTSKGLVEKLPPSRPQRWRMTGKKPGDD